MNCLSSLVIASVLASSACGLQAAGILVVGDNRNAIYQVDYANGNAADPASWSGSSVSLYAPLTLNLNEAPFGITRDPTSKNVYLSTVTSTGGSRILKVDPSGTQTVLAERGVATPNWSTANANGITLGADGKIYFATAFGTGNTQGIFRLNSDGTGFEQFVAPSGTGYSFTLATRDLAWVGDKLYVTQRNTASGNNVFRFNSDGTFDLAFNTFKLGPQSITYATDGLIYIGHNTSGTGNVRSYNPVNGAGSSVSGSTSPANALGLLEVMGAIVSSDYNAGAGSTAQLRLASATVPVLYAFAGQTDPLSPTGALLNGFHATDLTFIPEPTSIASLLLFASVVRRSRSR